MGTLGAMNFNFRLTGCFFPLTITYLKLVFSLTGYHPITTTAGLSAVSSQLRGGYCIRATYIASCPVLLVRRPLGITPLPSHTLSSSSILIQFHHWVQL